VNSSFRHTDPSRHRTRRRYTVVEEHNPRTGRLRWRGLTIPRIRTRRGSRSKAMRLEGLLRSPRVDAVIEGSRRIHCSQHEIAEKLLQSEVSALLDEDEANSDRRTCERRCVIFSFLSQDETCGKVAGAIIIDGNLREPHFSARHGRESASAKFENRLSAITQSDLDRTALDLEFWCKVATRELEQLCRCTPRNGRTLRKR